MGLGDLLKNRHERTPLSKEEFDLMVEIFPNPWQGDVAPKYRQYLVREFLDEEKEIPRRNENGAYQTAEKSRLHRSKKSVSERFDRDEETIISGVIGMYEDGLDSPRAQLLKDLKQIEDGINQ